MRVSRKTWLKLSAASLLAPMPVVAQTQASLSGAAPMMQAQADQGTTAPPGTAPTSASTTSPQGPSQIGQSEAAQVLTEQSGLQEIVITAQQRTESLQKAAVAVAVVSGADLINAGVRGLESLGRLTPSLIVASGSQGNILFIRGIGNLSATPGSDPAAAFNVDGVYVSRSSSTFSTFFDLERVEVLKGPQGTLYGRNATGGTINVIPVQPRFGEVSGYAVGTYGNYNTANLEGAMNVGLGEDAAFRVSATYTAHDGYLTDGTQSENTGGVRAQFKVKLTPDLTVRIEGDYARQGATGSGVSYVGKYAFNPVTSQFVITPSGLPLDSGLFSAVGQAYRTSNGVISSIPTRSLDPLIFLPYQNNETYGIDTHVDWQTPIGTFSVLPAWRHANKNNLSTDSAGAVGDVQSQNQYSVEARLVSNRGKLFDYILGAYYFSERINDDTHTGSGVQNGYTQSQYDTHSPAFYGRLTLHATDWLRFTGGVRYTEDHKTFSNLARTLTEVCVLPAACPTATLLPYTTTLEQQPIFPPVSGGRATLAPGVLVARTDVVGSGKLDQSKVNYRGAVEVDAGPRSLLYASVETGYRAGGFNTAFNYGPETITAYTIGAKNRFLDNRVQLNVELYDWEYHDQQITYLGVDPLGRIGLLTQNIGRSTNRGAEVEGRALVTPTTTLSVNVQYLDVKYNSFTYTSPARPVTGCAVTPVGATFVIDCSGQVGINAPKWTVNFGAEQVIPIGDYQLVLSADGQYRSGRYVGFDYISTEYVDHVFTANAQVSIGAKDGRYALAAFVRNIGNDRSPIYGTPAPATNLIVSLPGTPRLYGLRLSTRF